MPISGECEHQVSDRGRIRKAIVREGLEFAIQQLHEGSDFERVLSICAQSGCVSGALQYRGARIAKSSTQPEIGRLLA